MKLQEAILRCHVRSAVYRKAQPNVKYWKNHPEPIFSRVPEKYRDADDWLEYDPRDDSDCSLASD